jgi:hypothetical protein
MPTLATAKVAATIVTISFFMEILLASTLQSAKRSSAISVDNTNSESSTVQREYPHLAAVSHGRGRSGGHGLFGILGG